MARNSESTYILQRLSSPIVVHLLTCYLGAQHSAWLCFQDPDDQCRVYGGYGEEDSTCYIELNVVGDLLERFLEPQHNPGCISILAEVGRGPASQTGWLLLAHSLMI